MALSTAIGAVGFSAPKTAYATEIEHSTWGAVTELPTTSAFTTNGTKNDAQYFFADLENCGVRTNTNGTTDGSTLLFD